MKSRYYFLSVLSGLILISVFFINLIIFPVQATNSTQTWHFTSAGDYSYNTSYLEVALDSGNTYTRLKDLGGATYRKEGIGIEFNKRKKITVSNSVASELTDYQVSLTVAYDSDMQADFDDLRFTTDDGSTQIDYWLETKTDSVSATVWVEVPSIPASSTADIYMYYGNAGASSASSLDNTMKNDYSSDANLLGQWLFDEGAGTEAADSSGNGHDGTINWDGTADWTGADNFFSSGDAIELDGSGIDQVTTDIQINTNLNNDFTLETWAIIDESADGWGWFFGAAGDTFLFGKQSGTTQLHYNMDGIGCNGEIGTYAVGEWHHFVFTHDKSEADALKIYIDGSLVGTYDAQGFSAAATGNIVFGSISSEILDGQLDEIRVYTRYLEAGEVLAHYNHATYATTAPIATWDDEESVALAGWTKRQVIEVINSNASELINFPVQMNIDYDSDMQADFDDLRFTTSNGSTQIDYWLAAKTDSLTATVWVEVPTLAASSSTTLYMYYGKADANSASSLDNTMTRDYSNDDNLLLQWLMDEGSGLSVADSSGNGNDGTLVYDVAGTGGWYGADNYFTAGDAIEFDDDGDGTDKVYSDVQINTNLNNDFTLEAWVYLDDAASNWGSFFNDLTGSTFQVNKQTGNNQMIFVIAGLGAEYGINGLEVGSWNHLVLTHDKSEASAFKVYINGTLARTADYQGLSPTTTGNLAIGSDNWSILDGKMDETRVYTRYMAEDEVTAHYNHQKYAASDPLGFVSGLEENVSYSNIKITPATGISYANLSGLTETLGSGNAGSVAYQISNDGTNWYYYNGAGWTAVVSDLTDNNTGAEVNTNLSDFDTEVGTGDLFFKAFLISDGTQKVELDSLVLTYNTVPQAGTALLPSGTEVALSGTASATAGVMLGTHQATSWKIQTGSNCSVASGVAWSSLADTTNKTSITYSGLDYNTTYYLCVANHDQAGQ